MSGLDWTLSIHDNISKPAKEAAGALRASEDALLGNDEAAKKAQSAADRLAESKKKLAAASRAMAAAAKAESDAITKAQAASMAAHDKAAAKVRSDDARTKGIAAKLASDVKMGSLDAMLAAKNQGRGTFADGRSLSSTRGESTHATRMAAATRAAMQGLTKAFGPGALDSIKGFTDAYDKVGPVLSAIAGPARAAASALLALGVAGVGLAAGATKMLYDATQWKQSTMFGLSAMLGGQKAASAAYSMVAKTSASLGLDLHESMASFQSLSGQFGTQGADKLLRMFADLKRIAPTAQIENMSLAIRQIQSTGKLQGDELRQLTDQGALSSTEIYDQIAASMKLVGKNADETRGKVAKMISAGKVDAKTAVDAIMAAAEKKTGGPAGSLAEKAMEDSLSGQLAKAGTLKDLLLAGAKVDWSPLTNATKRLNAALESKAAKAFVDAVGTQLSRAFAAVDKISQADIEGVFTAGAKAVTMLGDGLAFAWKWGSALLKSTEGIAPTFTLAYYAGATLIDPVMRTADAVRSIISAIAGAISKVYELAGGFDRAAAAAGAVAAASAGIEAAAGGGKLGKGVAGGTFGLAGAPGLLANGYMAAHDFLGRASGGPVTGGTPYVVGEEGPELFLPRQSGQIVPNDMMARVGRAGERMGQSISNVNNSRSIGNVTVHVNGDGGGALANSFEDALRSVVSSWA